METEPTIERSVIEQAWHDRGFTCGLWIDHAGRTWTVNEGKTEELFMALSGEIEIEIAGNRLRPEIGEEIHIPAHIQHTIKNIGGRTARWLYGQKLYNQLTIEPSHSTEVEPTVEVNH